MKFEKKGMVNWFDPGKLGTIAIKAVISDIFGNFADKREIEAALDDSEESFYKDYSKSSDIWVDYISDLGEGFESTYTIAHLMAQPELEADGKKLKRGDILIMGGDQVYPTPEIEEYQNRLQGPYEAAFPWEAGRDKVNAKEKGELPHLYALPGNHDWYDGLSNFIKLFCQERAMGNRLTQQKRSYFAIKLPHNYWVWGIDIQLSSDIDMPQLKYFEYIAKNKMKENDKVILCTAEPAWVYCYAKDKDTSFDRLKFFVETYIEKNKLQLIVMLTGDLHHYSRYKFKNKTYEGLTLIIAGGGGAFMHATHYLKDKFNIINRENAKVKKNKGTLSLEKTFPSKSTSRKLAFWNLFFPVWNWFFAFSMGIFFVIMAWYLQSTTKLEFKDSGLKDNTQIVTSSSYMDSVKYFEISFQNIAPVISFTWNSLKHNPSVVILNILLLTATFFFSKLTYRKWTWVLGLIHGVAQLAAFYFLVWLISRINLFYFREMNLFDWNWNIDSVAQVFTFSVEMIIFGGILSGLVFGIYLIVCTLVFNVQDNEAYSSLRLTGYKNFLRMHISEKGLEIYPIGVEKIVKNWTNVGTEEEPKFEGDKIKYDLIEPPIILK